MFVSSPYPTVSLLLLFVYISPSEAAGGPKFTEVYTNGDIVLENPLETLGITILVIMLCVALEAFIEWVESSRRKSVRSFVETISGECTVVGILSLILSFGASVAKNIPERWMFIFNWAHMCLFFMTISMVLVIATLLLGCLLHSRHWAQIEARLLNSNVVEFSFTGGHYDNFRRSRIKFQDCLRLRGYSNADVTCASYAQYMIKCQRKCLIHLMELRWQTWLALTFLIVLNAVRTRIISYHEVDGFIDLSEREHVLNLITYVCFSGYVPLAGVIFFVLYLQFRLSQYLGKTPENTSHSDNPVDYLVFANKDLTLNILQVFVMFLTWYISVFCLSILHSTLTKLTGFKRALVLIALPPVVVTISLLPRAIYIVTILSNLGPALDKKLAAKIIEAAGGDVASSEDEEELQEIVSPTTKTPPDQIPLLREKSNLKVKIRPEPIIMADAMYKPPAV